ncbi:MAG: 50S ribosomal protein L14e [Candidatus Hodarchaeales archaeon]|jgi:large subunit ribosomal protein L14e
MAAIEVGRVIVKTAGREALMKAVIVDLVDQNFVLISGGGVSAVKRRRIKRGAKDDVIQKAIDEAGLLDEMKEPLQITV